MGRMCAMSGCGISSGNKQRVSVHAFPGASSQFRRLWINFVTTVRKDFVLRDNYHGICGRHFEEHSFQDQHTWKVKVEAGIRVRRQLKEDAVPTVITEKCIKALSVRSPAASASLKRNSDTDSVRSKRAKLRDVKKDIAEHQAPQQVQVSAQQPYALVGPRENSFAGRMDPVKREVMEDDCAPVMDSGAGLKQEPPWSMEDECPDQPSAVYSPDQPSAVYSPVQPLADSTCGSVLSVNTGGVCQRCSATFVLVSSLELHLAVCHGEPLPFSELPESSAGDGLVKDTDKMNRAYGGWSTSMQDDVQRDPGDSAFSIAVKQEPPWSMEEECPDQPSAVYSQDQPSAVNSPDQPSAVYSQDQPSAVYSQYQPSAVYSQDQPSAVYSQDQPSAVYSPDQPSAVYSQDQPSAVYSQDQPSAVYSPDQPSAVYSPDQPSAVYSPVQPLADNACGSVLSVNTGGVCQRCSAAFVLVSSLELHLAVCHGVELHAVLPVAPTPDGCDAAEHDTTDIDRDVDSHSDRRVMEGEKEKFDENGGESDGKKRKKHSCDVCGKTFPWAYLVKKHAIIHNVQKPFMCDVCNKSFPRDYALRRHKLIHSNHRPYVCDVCRKTFTEAAILKRHKRMHSGLKPFVCDVCSKAFTEAGLLRRHQLTHSSSKPFICDVCSKGFTETASLKKHKLIHTGHKPYMCDVCSKSFTEAGTLRKHKVIHTGHKQFVCDVCNKAFTWACDLKTHKRIHSGPKPFACDQCNLTFAKVDDLAVHKLIHTGPKPYVCDVCSKMFAQASDLRRHQLIHTGQKSFLCDVCSMAFTHAGHLKSHKRVHTKERPYKCPHCDSDFKWSSNLQNHLKLIHPDGRPCACDVCGAAFSRKIDLKTHRKIHTGEKP